MRTCTLLNLGGTITERYEGGAVYRLSAADLVARAASPALRRGCDVEVVDSTDLDLGSLVRARSAMRADPEAGAFVLCCGTDALEEVAYAAALLLDRERPVVVTGAIHPSDHPAADGGVNLAAAADLALRMPRGASPVVAFGRRVFDPARIVKLDPRAAAPFGPRGAVLGRCDDDPNAWIRAATCIARAAPAASPAGIRVSIIPFHFGAAPAIPDAGAVDGLVLAGAGAGGIGQHARAALAPLARRMPVVVSTRCPTGFPPAAGDPKHGLAEERRLGFVVDGYAGLDAAKARLKLIMDIASARV